jgi:hypothetical protein
MKSQILKIKKRSSDKIIFEQYGKKNRIGFKYVIDKRKTVKNRQKDTTDRHQF